MSAPTLQRGQIWLADNVNYPTLYEVVLVTDLGHGPCAWLRDMSGRVEQYSLERWLRMLNEYRFRLVAGPGSEGETTP